MDAQYQKDIERMTGKADTSGEDYKKFAAEMGFTDSAPPPSTSNRPSFADSDGNR